MGEIYGVRESYIQRGNSRILVFESLENNKDPFRWIYDYKGMLEEQLLKYGGVLLRNFNVRAVSEFNKIVQIISPNLLDYVYRSTPRTRLGGKIYTATEYPADRIIPLHNENAYSRSWPEKIFFFSILVADQGGETPIVDSRHVYNRIDPQVKDRFEEKGVLYVRNYRLGMDLSWQEVFQTRNREEVESYCTKNDITFAWDCGPSELITRQVCQASLVHPQTQEKVWFNQAHLFHVSSIDPESKESLMKEYGLDYLPRNAFYGDGSPLEEEVLNHIRRIYEDEKIVFGWKRGDIMVLDNRLMAHGRQPFKGERKVAVAMA